ncbi:MAG TPA: hypothetical protein VNU93_00635 [Verrucomicrobiae bacterium]|nr:hypothetical protein [Verrucomicrobiae bacterium]
MRKKRHFVSKGLALFALGAAVGAGVSMLREQKSQPHWVEDGGGPVEVDL